MKIKRFLTCSLLKAFKDLRGNTQWYSIVFNIWVINRRHRDRSRVLMEFYLLGLVFQTLFLGQFPSISLKNTLAKYHRGKNYYIIVDLFVRIISPCSVFRLLNYNATTTFYSVIFIRTYQVLFHCYFSVEAKLTSKCIRFYLG